MKNNFVTVLDFGSSKLTCMSATRLCNGEFVVKAVAEEFYDGFSADGFYSKDKLSDVIGSVLTKMQEKTGRRIKSVIVGVPGAFSVVATSEASKTFMSNKKVDVYDLNEIVNQANIFTSKDVINLGGRVVYYIVDGTFKMKNPVGTICNKLSALVAFSFMNKEFFACVNPILKTLGVRNALYISENSALGNYVGQQIASDNAIIIDVGHISTSVLLSCEGTTVFSKSFALGSGYLAGDLMQVVNCKYPVAMELLGKMNLNLDFQDGDCYQIEDVTVPANKANDVVKARISQIGDYIKKSFSFCEREVPHNTPILLTGGGLTYLKGAPESLSASLNKPIKVYSADTEFNRNEHVSTYALIYYAFDTCNGNFRRK